MDNNENNTLTKKGRFRLDIALIVGIIMIISFSAYLINTDLEDVLEDELGGNVVTHDYTYDSSEK